MSHIRHITEGALHVVPPDVLLDELKDASDALDVVAVLVKQLPENASLMLAEIDTAPPGKEQLGKHPDIQKFVPTALRMREEYGVPFWMAVMLSAGKHDGTLPEAVFKAASFHQEVPSGSSERVLARDVSRDALLARGGSLTRYRMLTLLSQVVMADGAIFHLPMLDFRVPSSIENLPTVRSVLHQLGVNGVVLSSGRSYHFYGTKLILPDELRIFLARALFFTPLIDYRWIAHQLVEGRCALRIIRNGDGASVPEVVGVVR